MASGTLRVAELWRYPVKSLRGECLRQASLGADGILGDRIVHVREPSGRVVTARYRPRLLGLQASLDDDGEPLIDRHRWDTPAAFRAVREASAIDTELVRVSVPARGQRFDVMNLTVLTDGAVAAIGIDHRRFRPNILIAGANGLAERSWVGNALSVGEALIGVWRARRRCVMTTFHPDTLEQDLSVLRRIVSDFDGRLALDCWVITPGAVRIGDRASVVELPVGAIPPGQ